MELKEFEDHSTIVLLRKIGQGGMSIVYEGLKLGVDGFEKNVAVKMLLDRWMDDPRFLKLFVDEAKLVSDLVHENIVQIYQLGRIKDGPYYIVMEYVEGLALRAIMDYHLDREKYIPTELAVHIASRIARGLSYAHQFKNRQGQLLGIVHRDVCANNILLTTEGRSALTDFGIAKAFHHTVIRDNWLTGKVSYMSPEQAGRKALDFRSDIYSLGAVLFEMLANEPIRDHDCTPLTEDFSKLPIPWKALPKETDQDLVKILKKMLDPTPEQRYQSTNILARDLEYYIYKDGYGPTIQTIESYLREHFPHLYDRGGRMPEGKVTCENATTANASEITETTFL